MTPPYYSTFFDLPSPCCCINRLACTAVKTTHSSPTPHAFFSLFRKRSLYSAVLSTQHSNNKTITIYTNINTPFPPSPPPLLYARTQIKTIYLYQYSRPLSMSTFRPVTHKLKFNTYMETLKCPAVNQAHVARGAPPI